MAGCVEEEELVGLLEDFDMFYLGLLIGQRGWGGKAYSKVHADGGGCAIGVEGIVEVAEEDWVLVSDFLPSPPKCRETYGRSFRYSRVL